MGDLAAPHNDTQLNSYPNQIDQHPRGRNALNAKLYFSQYCGATSIHGIQYLGERGRYIIEKIVWLIIIITVATCSTILVLKTYNKWVTSPVIVTFDTTETSISSIPFPAVTICPEVKTDAEMFNFTDVYIRKLFQQELSEFDSEAFKSISLICNMDLQELQNVGEDELFTNDSTVFNLLALFPDFNSANLSKLSWQGNDLDPEVDLTYLFTSEGVCYSFNMLDVNDIAKDPEDYMKPKENKSHDVRQWSLDNGYPTSDVSDSYPRRTFLSGPNGGFLFDGMTVRRKDLDYLCKESLQGYKVVLHHPAEWPNLDRHFRVPLNSAVFVGIKPKVTSVSTTLKNYDPVGRKCYFTDERPLVYFHNYTQNNCLQECLSNYTLRTCNCLGFYMPKDKDTPTCGVKSLNCLHQSKIDYLSYDKEICSCLPSCTGLEYDLELSTTDWDWHRAIDTIRATRPDKEELFLEYDKIHMSRLSIYFKDNQFLGSERNELYGPVDFLSNVGGLLGLFIGISITSFIEVIYFCTLRLYCNLKIYGRKYWSGEQELVDEDERNNAKVL